MPQRIFTGEPLYSAPIVDAITTYWPQYIPLLPSFGNPGTMPQTQVDYVPYFVTVISPPGLPAIPPNIGPYLNIPDVGIFGDATGGELPQHTPLIAADTLLLFQSASYSDSNSGVASNNAANDVALQAKPYLSVSNPPANIFAPANPAYYNIYYTRVPFWYQDPGVSFYHVICLMWVASRKR